MNKHTTTPGYQYRTRDGQQFDSKDQLEYYLEQQLEKKEQARDDQYRDSLDRVPTWDYMDNINWEG